ncbi:MAG: LacI family DNA-binding transcriptional regulator [Kiritimatiellales bacterium]
MTVTQKDIAKKIGLSPSLVSRVLSGRAREVAISEETIKKVTELAEKMGYVPNIAAQSLKGIPSRTIGVMVSYFSDPFFGQIVDALLQRAKDLDYSVVLSGFHFNSEPDDRELRPLLKHQLDGLIVVGSSQHINWMKELSETRIPIARVGHGPANEFASRVAIDEDKAMKKIMQHLRDEECRQAAFLGFEETSMISHERLLGFMKYAGKLGMEVSAPTFIPPEADIRTAIKISIKNLLNAPTLPHAVVCVTDHLALHLINELREHNLSVPKDIAVVGIDDIPLAHIFHPKLTTVHQPIAQLVKLAFDIVIENQIPHEVILDPQLIIRESSIRKNKA